MHNAQLKLCIDQNTNYIHIVVYSFFLTKPPKNNKFQFGVNR